MDQLASEINNRMKKGDTYFNQAATNTNRNQYEQALKDCDSALTEFGQGKTSAQQGVITAKNSQKQVYIEYFQLTLQELDLRINATTELKQAIPDLRQNSYNNANKHLDLSNSYMQDSMDIKAKKQELINQNPSYFK
jgi:hypothetical protein